jgi:hypothetical protein
VEEDMKNGVPEAADYAKQVLQFIQENSRDFQAKRFVRYIQNIYILKQLRRDILMKRLCELISLIDRLVGTKVLQPL